MALSLLETFVEHEKNNKDFGFYWENLDQILDQIRSECDEIKDAYLKNDAEHIQEEVGDVINAAISLCVFLNLDLEETLQKNLQKFENRFNIMVELVKKDGLKNLQGQSSKTLLEYWEKAKKIANSQL